ncbi:MAG: hypothetical protein Q8M03_14675 [Legionella sp.]|nr:hypothetical protein [Legionella sp.]
MINIFLKTIIALLVLIIFPLETYAEEELNQTVKDDCITAWIDSGRNRSNLIEYKNLGEQYCDCVSVKPLNSAEEVGSTAELCMSQVLLHDTMRGLAMKFSREQLSQEMIQSGCFMKLKIIYPQMNKNQTVATTNYCHCAVPKIAEINNKNLTDKQWTEKIDRIAAECASQVTNMSPT